MPAPKLAKRTTTVVLFQSEDTEKLEQLRRDVDTAVLRSDAPKRLNDGTVQGAMLAHDKFLDEAAERGVKIELKALSRVAYRDMKNAHPPRRVKDSDDEDERVHEADAEWGFNVEEMADALVPASVVDAKTFTAKWLDELAEGDWSKIFRAAIDLNRDPGPDPTLRLGSAPSPSSDATSPSPARFS